MIYLWEQVKYSHTIISQSYENIQTLKCSSEVSYTPCFNILIKIGAKIPKQTALIVILGEKYNA